MNEQKVYTLEDNVRSIMFTLKKMLAELEAIRQAADKKDLEF